HEVGPFSEHHAQRLAQRANGIRLGFEAHELHRQHKRQRSLPRNRQRELALAVGSGALERAFDEDVSAGQRFASSGLDGAGERTRLRLRGER
nr:hypothetical protein [Tanacetum cinerariifolium]